ncbi:MAG TPA: transcription antitermination factor NusB, partial [bacterium]|nr:transcription antitermination factor NusB [bacterium]
MRRRSREKTLQILYGMDFNKKGSYEEAVEEYYIYYNIPAACPDAVSDEEERQFITYLLATVFDNRARIESL